MNLLEIPKGEVVLLDADIVIYAVMNSSAQCRELLRRCAAAEAQGIIASQQLAEVIHRLMLVEARENGWITAPNPARHLAGQQERIRRLTRYEEAVKGFMATGVKLEPVLREDFLQALSIQRQVGLMTNDALMAAVADRLRIVAVASADRALKSVARLTVYEPGDLSP